MQAGQPSSNKASDTPLSELNAEATKEIYSSLKEGEIRIVKLHAAASQKEQTCCTLETIRLDAAPPYCALSYVWGSTANPKTILLNGKSFKVTQELEAALAHLRDPDEDKPMWIDALAINQCDVLERNSQVQIMRDIYSEAEVTIAWLGQGIDIIKHYFMLMVAMQLPDEERPLLPSGSKLFEFSILAMSRLAKLPYWERVWVVQEIMYSRNMLVQYGDIRTGMDFFRGLWATVCQLDESDANIFQLNPQRIEERGLKFGTAMPAIRNMFIGALRPGAALKGDFLDYGTWTWAFCMSRQCYDPRDKVYGYYGCFPPQVREKIAIDYRRPTEEIYMEATRIWEEHKGNLQTLDAADLYRRTPIPGAGLPSWCMDYNQGDPPPRLLFEPIKVLAERPKSFYFSSNDRILRVKALQLGTVSKCSKPFEILSGKVEDGSLARTQVLDYYQHSKDILIVTDENLDAFITAFGGSRFGLKELRPILNSADPPEGGMKGQDTVNALILGTLHHSRRMFAITPYPSLFNVCAALKNLSQVTFGLGPCETAPGDEIFLVSGCRYALTLRQNGDHYIRIGSAFLSELEQLGKDFTKMDVNELVDISLC